MIGLQSQSDGCMLLVTLLILSCSAFLHSLNIVHGDLKYVAVATFAS